MNYRKLKSEIKVIDRASDQFKLVQTVSRKHGVKDAGSNWFSTSISRIPTPRPIHPTA